MAGTLYLLDTNILSHAMRNPTGQAAQRIAATVRTDADARACTSIVVQCELLFGLHKRTHPRWQSQYLHMLGVLEVLPLDSAIAPHYAQLRSKLESQGTPIGPNDTWIAAHALALDAILVSADTEFGRVPGLKLENWLATETT